MVFIKTDNKNEVVYIRYNLIPEMNEIDTSEGVIFDNVPVAENIEGKISRMMHDPEKNELYFIYEDIQPDPEDPMTRRINELEAALVELAALLGGE